MKNRILLKEIPADKFHSVIFTTYSVNLYYLEQQVLPLLGSKNIHYVSVLADANMLTAQLDAYCLLSERKKRNYAIHGVQCSGAFHPKLIFLAGDSTLLLLLGSGNLTSSGHGKNLESWNAIYIEEPLDKKLGFIIQAWNYLKELHTDLGNSAQDKLKTIEENCGLLKDTGKVVLADTYDLNDEVKISFLAALKGRSIFEQLSTLVDTEPIKEITVMSPYYDSKGYFLHELNKRYAPQKINIILQDDFGAIPFNVKKTGNMNFCRWQDIRPEGNKQPYFHAKNIFFKGKNRNFLLSGSANASVAAFGTAGTGIINQEACLLYQSRNDLMKGFGIRFGKENIDVNDIERSVIESENIDAGDQSRVFIKAIEKNYENTSVWLLARHDIAGAIISFFDEKGIVLFSQQEHIGPGHSVLHFNIPNNFSLLYCEVSFKDSSISNRQFVIDINAFESTNPSFRNRSLNQIRKLIENGNFSTAKIIEYLNTIYKQNDKKPIPVKAAAKPEDGGDIKNVIIEEDTDLLYLSYEQIQQKIKQLDAQPTTKGFTDYKSVRLWDSIFSYLKDARELEEQSGIDEEETEDINSSTGRADSRKKKEKKPIRKSNFDRLHDKIIKFLLDYSEVLSSKIGNKKADKPNLIDISMYLIILEVLLHLAGHTEKIEEDGQEEYLLEIGFSDDHYSWSDFTIHIIGLFALWCTQKEGFKEIVSEEYELKLDLYKKMAFQTSVCTLSLFSVVNQNDEKEKIKVWKKLALLNADLCFNTEQLSYREVSGFFVFYPQPVRDIIGDANLAEAIHESLQVINKDRLQTGRDFYRHPDDGIAFIEKTIVNSNNEAYLKLIHPGYEWDAEITDYWNGMVYSVAGNRWFHSRLNIQ